jgi:hypothetical protein
MALEVQGGYKFGGKIAFGLNNQLNLEGFPSIGSLFGFPVPDVAPKAPPFSFLSASMTIRDVFSAPLNITYFVGLNDVFGSGEGFAEFGAPPIMTRYRGFLYFPSTDLSVQPIYDGIYQVQGTGMKIEGVPNAEHASLDLYVYEDTHPDQANLGIVGPGRYSADFRFLLNWEAVKLEGFIGATITGAPPYSPYGYYRGGLLFYAINSNVEFLAQIGLPRWDPSIDTSFGVNLFYLLVEPRLHLGMFSIVPTFFWHPGYYMQTSYVTTESGTFDVNLNMYFGDQAKTSFQGGAEGNFQFHSYSGIFSLKASPWIGFTTPGIVWTVKVNFNLWPFVASSLVDLFVGVRAEI